MIKLDHYFYSCVKIFIGSFISSYHTFLLTWPSHGINSISPLLFFFLYHRFRGQWDKDEHRSHEELYNLCPQTYLSLPFRSGSILSNSRQTFLCTLFFLVWVFFFHLTSFFCVFCFPFIADFTFFCPSWCTSFPTFSHYFLFFVFPFPHFSLFSYFFLVFYYFIISIIYFTGYCYSVPFYFVSFSLWPNYFILFLICCGFS